MGGVAIDCGWLVTLDELNYEDLLAAINLLEQFEQLGWSMLLDVQGGIRGEYERKLPSQSLGRKYSTSHMRKGMVAYRDGIPTARCAAGLGADGFDDDDYVYIGVAQGLDDGIYLTHERKHLEPKRRQAVMKSCGVTVGGTAELTKLLA